MLFIFILHHATTYLLVLNYDIDPNHTEHDDYTKLNFDIVVFNHVLMYINEKEIFAL